MIQYYTVVCYDKILVNVAAYVIPVTCVCVCGVITYAATFTKILSQQHTTILYCIILIIHNSS